MQFIHFLDHWKLFMPFFESLCIRLCHSITVHWIDKNGNTTSTPAEVGTNLLSVAHKHGIDLPLLGNDLIPDA